MKLLFKKCVAALCSVSCLLSCAQNICLAADENEETLATLAIGKICISADELAQNNYTVSVPVWALGAQNGVVSFDSTYIAFGDIDTDAFDVELNNSVAQGGNISITQEDIVSENFSITSSFELVSNDIAAFSVGGYCSEIQRSERITLFELSFTLPESAQIGDVFNIAWFDELNSQLSPAVSSQNGDYDISYINGAVYIGSLGVDNYSQYENMYFAEDTEALTGDIGVAINPDVQGHSVIDISQLVCFGIEGVRNFDLNCVENGDDAVSAFDLYWGSLESGNPTNAFSGNCKVDSTCFDVLCRRIGEFLGVKLSGISDTLFFENVLFDDNGKALNLGQYDFRIVQRGDSNLNHTVDAKDAAAIARYSSQMASVIPGESMPELNSDDNELAQFAADVNGDGAIDAKDAANVARFASQSAISPYDEAKAYYTIWNDILN